MKQKLNAIEWMQKHAASIPVELGDTEGHLSLNFRHKTDDGDDAGEFGDTIESMDTWFIPNSGLYQEPQTLTDPDADWLM